MDLVAGLNLPYYYPDFNIKKSQTYTKNLQVNSDLRVL